MVEGNMVLDVIDTESREVPAPTEEAGLAETQNTPMASPEPDVSVRVSEPEDMALRDLLKLLDQATRAEARKDNEEILSLISDLGGNASRYKRERSKALRAVVSEIYSPPRVSAVANMCSSFGILPGFALDLTTHDVDGRHWDFDEEEMWQRAWAKVKSEEPLLLIGSPMCTAFSAWQYINNVKRDPEVARRRRRGARDTSASAVNCMSSKQRMAVISYMSTRPRPCPGARRW